MQKSRGLGSGFARFGVPTREQDWPLPRGSSVLGEARMVEAEEVITLQSGLIISNSNFSMVLEHFTPARVIIAVPHDGLIANDFSGMFQVRTNGIRGRDKHVWPVANDIVHKGLKLGVCIDTVRFLVARAYVDANREMADESNLDPDTRGQTALDDEVLSPMYRWYHSELRRLVECSVQEFGPERVLFIDLHGFGRQPKIAPRQGYDLILGTANRATVPHGDVDRAFARFMDSRGYCVFLPGERPIVPEGDPYSAGHTTRWYSKEYGINALQIEIFSAFRNKEGQARGEQLACDMAEFLAAYYR